MSERCGETSTGPNTTWVCVAEPHPGVPGHAFQKRTQPICPECKAGKHTACLGDALDDQLDEITECRCYRDFHQDRSPT